MTDTGTVVTTHVLDTAHGHPASGVEVCLEDAVGDVVGTGRTNEDGRVAQLGPARLGAGTYRLRFDVGAWFEATGTEAFYPEVVVSFVVRAEDEHHHVPLLLSPFGYSTYRGS